MSIAINGSVTLDESAGLQDSGTAVGAEDNNDSDVAVGSLPSAFSSRLFGAPAAGLGLSNVFPTAVGVGKSPDNYITVTATGTITSLGFTKPDGSALPAYAGAATGGVASPLSTVAGDAISLFADASLGSRMVLGVDATNQIALAMFMEPNAALTSAKVWTVQLKALSNPDATNPDDPVTLTGLGVGAGVSTEFNFNALPSGQNLFGTVGNTSTALVVIGKTPVLHPDGTFTNASNTINTSQGGGPTTIGVNNQMFDQGDGAYFTFVKNPDPNYLAGAPNGLDQNEADDADNIVFQKRLEALGGFVKIAQIQGNSAATIKISLFNGGDSDNVNNNDDQRVLTGSGLGTGSTATITKITVRNAAGQVVQTLTGAAAAAGVVTGLGANFQVAWESSALHDQVLIEAVAGKFDIGGFGVNEPSSELSPLTGVRFEDDGPAITGTAKTVSLTVDETVLTTNHTVAVNPAGDFTPTFGQDGAGASGTTFTYAFANVSGDSGLDDTATGLSVFLFNESGSIVGRAGADATAAASGPVVFTVSVSASGNVTLDQQRAVVHANTSNPDDSRTLTLSGALVVTGTATDKDGDSASGSVNDNLSLTFEDDGPSITATAGGPTLTVDETVLATNATGAFVAQFSPIFGNDGAGATPVSYAVSTPGGDSGVDDTLSGLSVFLFNEGGKVVGRAGADATAAASGPVVFEVSVDGAGNVTLDQQRSVVHPDATDPDDSRTLASAGLVVLTATATDGDGDSASAPLNIGLQLVMEDDGPSITATAVGAPTPTVDESDLLTNDTDGFAAQFTPVFGADGPGATPRTYALSTPGGNSGLVDTATGENVVLSLVGGQIQGRTAIGDVLVFTVSVDGSGNVTLDQQRAVVHPNTASHDEPITLASAGLVVLTATAHDGDGDTASAPLNIGQLLVFEDDGPSITATAVGAPTLTVDETLLGTDATGAFAAQFTPVFGADGPGATPRTYALSTPGGDSGLVDTASGQAVVLSLAGGQVQGRTATSDVLVFTVSVDGSGNVTLDQLRAVVHPDTTNPDDSVTLAAANLVVLTGTAHDGDADTASAPLNIGQLLVFEDDGPSITATAVGAPTLTVDETVLATNATGAFAAQFTPVFGADGQGATPRTYALSTPGGASGLVDTATGQNVVLSLVGGQVQGRTATSNALVFTVSVDGSGNVTLDQLRAVVHPDTTNPDDSVTLAAANLVVLTGTAHDGDGDTASAPLNIGQLLAFEDDGPAIGPIDNSVVDFAAGASVTKTLNGVIGADPNGAPYTVDSFTGSITVNGVQLQGVASGNNTVVTYYADTGGNGTFGDAGDTAFYRLTLGQAGAGTYTFEVLVNPPPATLQFDFDDLPSGQNLFGTVGDASSALVVIGKTPVLNSDGTFTNASNTINTSQGGGGVTIGVNNQMFDQGDGAYFTYVKSPDPRYLSGAPGGLDQNEADDADNILYTGGTLAATTASTTISQTQGNAAASMKITAFDIANSPQARNFVSGLGGGDTVTITSVKVNGVAVSFTPSGNGVIVGGLDAGDTIEWTTSAPHDRVLIECVAGKFDIGAFAITQAAPTPDQKLDFVVRATDGDGDFRTSGFSIGIDGTGVYDNGLVAGVNAPAGITSTMFSSRRIGGPGALLA